MNGQGFSVKTNGVFGFIFMILVLVALFFLAKGIFTLLAWASPVLILGAIIINYQTIINYFKFVLSLLKRSALTGIIVILLSIVGFPILSGVLFGKAILDRKVRRMRKSYLEREQGEFVQHEEVFKNQPEENFDLPPLEKPQPQKKDNRYEDLF